MAKNPESMCSRDSKINPETEPLGSWLEMEDLFLRVLEQPFENRAAFLDESCGDPALRRWVESMLSADEQAGNFLERPIVQRAPSEPGVRFEDDQIGPYRLERLLGKGGMGHVYLARSLEEDLERSVVIKMAREDLGNEELSGRLRIERRILSGLNHPAIARLYDGGTTEDHRPYFVMEYVEGEPIDAFCNRRRLTVEERLALFRDICAAVRYAHQNLVVHRDLKPSNILVTAEGKPKLLDFGIAKILDPETASGIDTTVGLFRPMTPGYASPEQFLRQRITTSSDIYSLGVLLYKLLNGHLPFDFTGLNLQEIERVVLHEEPVKPSEREDLTAEIAQARQTTPTALRRQLRGDLDSIVLKALRKTPEHRYGSVEELAEDLRCHLEGLPTSAHQGTWRYRSVKFFRRHRVALAVAALITVLVVGFLSVTLVQAVRLAHERDENQQVVALIRSIFQAADPYEKGDDGSDLTVRAALELSEEGIRRQLSDQPKVRATLFTILGRIHLSLGSPRAPVLLEEAWEIRRELFGERHPTAALTLSNLGLALAEQGEAAGKQKALDAVATIRESPMRESTLFLEALNNLVTLLCTERATDEADPLSREALELAESLPDISRADLFYALNNRAIILGRQGDRAGAQDLLQRALREQEENLGPNHPWVGETLNTLAVGLYRLQDYDQALLLSKRAAAIRQQHLGDVHPVLANSYNHFGDILRQQGDPSGALENYRKATQILSQTVPENLHRLLVETKMAQVLITQGELSAAESLLRDALEDWKVKYPDGSWVLSEAESALGECLVQQQQYSEAEILLTGSLKVFEGMGYARGTQETLRRIVRLYEEWGKPLDAAQYQERLDLHSP